jgi:hypothetical protein
MDPDRQNNFGLVDKLNHTKLGIKLNADENLFSLLLKIESRLRKEARNDLKVRIRETKALRKYNI